MDDSLRQEVLDTYEAYVKAFRENDVPALDKLIQYPLAYVGAGRTTLVDTYPVQPIDLMAAKQWHDMKDPRSRGGVRDPRQGPRDRAAGDALRADGSPIEIVSAFYALTRTAAGWRFFAFSDITVPISPFGDGD